MPRSGRGGTGSRIHSRAGSPTKIRGEEGTREACSAACPSPSKCVAMSSAKKLHEPPGGPPHLEAGGFAVEHRAATVGRETIAVHIHYVDIARALRNALFDDLAAFTNERFDQPGDNFLVRNIASPDPEFGCGFFDDLVNLRAGCRIPVFVIGVETGARLLPVAIRFDEMIQHPVACRVTLFLVAEGLPSLVTNIKARKVKNTQRT